MHTMPKVRQIMVEPSVTIAPDASAYAALDVLVSKKLNGIPVMGEGDVLVGFLTEKDCLRLQVNSHHYNMTGRTVRDIMSGITSGLHPDMDVLGASQVFLATNFGMLPVIESTRHVGSVMRSDLVHTIRKWHNDRGIDYRNAKTAQELERNPASIGNLQALVGKSNNEQLASVLRGRHKNNSE